MPADLAAAVVPAATTRMKRAAAFAFTASLGLAGCSSTTTSTDANVTDTAVTDHPSTDTQTTPDRPSPTDTQSPTDNPAVTDTGRDAPEDHGNIAPPYGIAADAGPPDDSGGAMADYGAPPPPVDGGR